MGRTARPLPAPTDAPGSRPPTPDSRRSCDVAPTSSTTICLRVLPLAQDPQYFHMFSRAGSVCALTHTRTDCPRTLCLDVSFTPQTTDKLLLLRGDPLHYKQEPRVTACGRRLTLTDSLGMSPGGGPEQRNPNKETAWEGPSSTPSSGQHATGDEDATHTENYGYPLPFLLKPEERLKRKHCPRDPQKPNTRRQLGCQRAPASGTAPVGQKCTAAGCDWAPAGRRGGRWG